MKGNTSQNESLKSQQENHAVFSQGIQGSHLFYNKSRNFDFSIEKGDDFFQITHLIYIQYSFIISKSCKMKKTFFRGKQKPYDATEVVCSYWLLW